MRHSFGTVLAVLAAISVSITAYAIPKPKYTVTASSLAAEFRSNLVATNYRYTDQVIKVSGVVKEINEGWATGGNIQILLSTGVKDCDLACNFPAGYRHNIDKIRVGSKATITGVYMKGRTLFGLTMLGLKDCFIP